MKKTPPPTAWRPGQSGNPKGRPANSGQMAKIRAAIAEAMPDILETLKEQALAGDVGAARLLLERTVPALRAAEQAHPLSLPDGSLTEQGRAVLASVGMGELAPAQGAQLLGAIASLARVAELDELTARIKALEGIANAKH